VSQPEDVPPATSSLLLKLEDVPDDALDALYDALDALVVEKGGSFYTLVENGKRVRVDEGSPHLVVERMEASLYAHARTLHGVCVEHGLPVPRQLARDYADFCAFFDREGTEDDGDEGYEEGEVEEDGEEDGEE
jgi:hypothetical protein